MSKQGTSVLDNLKGVAESFGGVATEQPDGTFVVTKTGPMGGQIHLQADGRTMVGSTPSTRLSNQNSQGPLHSCL